MQEMTSFHRHFVAITCNQKPNLNDLQLVFSPTQCVKIATYMCNFRLGLVTPTTTGIKQGHVSESDT
jgi:hypothetical protein